MPARETTTRYKFVSVPFAFLLWGGWPAFVNRASPGFMPYVSAVAQGMCGHHHAVDRTRRAPLLSRRRRAGLHLILPAVITITCTCTCTCSARALAHSLAGTRAFLAAIARRALAAYRYLESAASV